MNDQDYLIHYGVLGMKWGVRKDKNYKYTSMRTKSLTKKAAKAKSKGKVDKAKKLSAKARVSKKSDKNYLEYAKKTSVGKALAQNILFGPGGARTYQSMRANGSSRGMALALQTATKVSGLLIGSIAGVAVSKPIIKGVMLNTPAQVAIYDKVLKNLVSEATKSGNVPIPGKSMFLNRVKTPGADQLERYFTDRALRDAGNIITQTNWDRGNQAFVNSVGAGAASGAMLKKVKEPKTKPVTKAQKATKAATRKKKR